MYLITQLQKKEHRECYFFFVVIMNSLVQRTFQLDQQNEEGDGESMGGSLSYFYLITKEVTSG
jgi:hypothetical protein